MTSTSLHPYCFDNSLVSNVFSSVILKAKFLSFSCCCCFQLAYFTVFSHSLLSLIPRPNVSSLPNDSESKITKLCTCLGHYWGKLLQSKTSPVFQRFPETRMGPHGPPLFNSQPSSCLFFPMPFLYHAVTCVFNLPFTSHFPLQDLPQFYL